MKAGKFSPGKWPRKRRPIRIEGDVAYVPLTHGYEAAIDIADVPLVEGVSWFACIGTHTVYAVCTDRSGGQQRRLRMHRVLAGSASCPHVDHKDGDGLNNRRNNLRPATKEQNAQNARFRRDNTSGFKGAFLDRRRNKWEARIKANGESRFLGYFHTAEAAHTAYCRASAELHGEFGRTA